jgi:hypothetical protein
VARSTLADAKDGHDWRIYADFAQALVRIARPLYAADPIGVDLNQSLYALDSTTIDLCLSLFPWAKFCKHKAAVKMHTLLLTVSFTGVSNTGADNLRIMTEAAVPEPSSVLLLATGVLVFLTRRYQRERSV